MGRQLILTLAPCALLGCTPPTLAERCTDGDPVACWDQARTADDAEALEKFARAACDGGQGLACGQLGKAKYSGGRDAEADAAAFPLLKAGCKAGDGPSCLRVGLSYEFGSHGEKDPKAAAKSYAAGCELGDNSCCGALGICYAQGIGVETDLERALKLFRQACVTGEELSCADLGYALLYGKGAPADPEAGIDVLEKACARSTRAQPCYELGVFLWRAPEEKRDKQRIGRFMALACQRGKGEGCMWLGRLFEGDDNVGNLVSEAYGRGCKLMVFEACWRFGRLSREQGVDRELVRKVFRLACDGKHGLSCNELALEEREAGNEAEVHPLFGRACTHGDPWGCRNLARELLEKKPAAPPKRALELLERACVALKNKRGCADLGRALLPTDPKRATELLTRTCDADDTIHYGCAGLAQMHEDGVGVPADPARATALRTRYCKQIGYDKQVCRARPYKGRKIKAKVIESTLKSGPPQGATCTIGLPRLWEGDLCEIYIQCGDLGVYGHSTDMHWIPCKLTDKGVFESAKDDRTGDGDGTLDLDGKKGTARLEDNGHLDLEFTPIR